jgi:hypothetical protein
MCDCGVQMCADEDPQSDQNSEACQDSVYDQRKDFEWRVPLVRVSRELRRQALE